MLSSTKFRMALAVITLMGSYHLRTASASVTNTQDCEQRAIDYGTGYCNGSTGGNWSWGIQWYTVNPDGSCSFGETECY